jgi:heavy metal sensor kinase
MPFRPGHIRTRLTLQYLAVLACLLLLYGVGSSVLLWWDLRRELDSYAIQDIETVEGLLQFDSRGRLHFNEDYHNHPASKKILDRLLEVLAPDGAILLRNERLGARSLGQRPFAGEGVEGYFARTERLQDGTGVRLFSRFHIIGNQPVLIRLAYSEDSIWQASERFLLALLIALPFTLCLAALAGYALAKRALRPVDEMADRADQITPERLGERLPVSPAGDELAHLANVFNRMLARMELAFDRMRQFTSDASHELRTPLTAIRSVGEVGLQRNASAEEYRDVIGSMLEEVGRLTSLIENLLTISRADAGQIPLQLSTFRPMDLAKEGASLLGILSEEKNQEVVIAGDPDVAITADRLLVRQALVNVLHNAVRHTPVGGRIQLVVGRDDHSASLSVTDNGPGIAPDDCEKVFQRFYRVDNSRTVSSGGTGLGLPIARWVLEAHGGSLTLECKEDAGCTFRLRLPIAVNL